MNKKHFAILATFALAAQGVWATDHSVDEIIASISGNNVFNGKNITITFATSKDTSANGYLSVEGNGNNPITFRGKDDDDKYGYIINGCTYISGGGGSGALRIASGTYTFRDQLYIGQNGKNTSHVTVEGGIVDTSVTQVNLGQSESTTSYFVQTGGVVYNNNYYVSPGKDSYAEMYISGGSFTNKGVTTFGWNGATSSRDTAKVVISGDANVVLLDSTVNLGYAANRRDYITLNGGMLSIKSLKVYNTNSQGTLTFNGGTLRALESNDNFLQSSLVCNVSTNGAIIDTQTYSPTIKATLVHSMDVSSDKDGGLTKKGSGTLTFTTMPTFTGKITVVAGAGDVILPTGATIEAGAHTEKTDNGSNTIYSCKSSDYESGSVDGVSGTVYVATDWLTTVYGDAYSSGLPAGFNESALTAYALGQEATAASFAVSATPVDGGVTLYASLTPPNYTGATIRYKLETSANNSTWSTTTLGSPSTTIDLSAVDGVKYYRLAADVTW